MEYKNEERSIALAGNPNVGKSTVFNALTGMNQHTGNWPGKTVAVAYGHCTYEGETYRIVDLPGTYSLSPHSAEEELAGEYICSGEAEAVIVVCDATCLERNLILVLQTLSFTENVIVCVNLLDEARKKKIRLNLRLLEQRLGIPVVGTSARSKEGLPELLKRVQTLPEYLTEHDPYRPEINREDMLKNDAEEEMTHLVQTAEQLCRDVVMIENVTYRERERRLDKILTSRLTGIPIMLLLLCAVFWITIVGANVPSELLADLLFRIQDQLLAFCVWIHMPAWLYEPLIFGVYRVLAWVVSVMLPPMAIFFPLFTLLEDFGYLPRVAFNLDHCFHRACACGKQALTMCMGFGCNAAGITGCRIIDSPRERLIAILTNNFVPCNGRFPTLIAIISMFLIGTWSGAMTSAASAILLTLVILFGILMTFLVSSLLSRTVLKGVPSSFALELPPYRKPQIGKVIVRSIFDRTLFVLGRAVLVAAPAGLVIWVMANVQVDGRSLLACTSGFLDTFARLMGLDGVILLAFILGFPANEIVVPIIIMSYMATGSLLELNDLGELRKLLVQNGWTWVTAVCTMLFCLMHWPCSTACLTIHKETGSLKWTAAALLIPTVFGMLFCFLFAAIARMTGAA